MGLNLETRIGGIPLKNPVLVASGTFGHAKEFEKFIDLRELGGIVTKTITLKPRLGNPPPRIVETPAGMLNAIGLQNPGVERFIEEKLPYLKKLKIPIIASVMGYSIEEFSEVVKKMEKFDGIDGYELNLSCPNVSYGAKKSNAPSTVRMFAHDEVMIEEVVNAIRGITKKTVIAKLGPDVSDIGKMAVAAERGGADAISLINTFQAMVINTKTRKPVLANKTGGLSGPCVRPIAVRLTWEAAKKTKLPVIGIGGIMNANDALEFVIAGASAIQVGTANFMNPSASIEILDGIKEFMKRQKIEDFKSLIGSLQT
jgi:dihydroorotate dehydrogenase (NAD+) catalytic subunit